ncbi:MAG: alpha/beta hydrolase [Solobacterium sp.]|nr:alpha/beta hydrolase [Solobacterium sp.]
MVIYEYGDVRHPAVLLIHGMAMDVRKSFGRTIDLLKNDYHVMAAAMDGYDEQRTQFSSIALEAEKIAQYLRQGGYDHLYAIIGMSMGGFTSLDLVCRHGIRADRLVLDSGYLNNYPLPRLFAKAVTWGYQMTMQEKAMPLVRFLSKLLMGYGYTRKQLYENASAKTIENSEYACLTYQLPENLEEALKDTEVRFWYGKKEHSMIRGMQTLKARLPEMKEVCMGNYGHGQLMTEHPDKYARRVMHVLSEKQ